MSVTLCRACDTIQPVTSTVHVQFHADYFVDQRTLRGYPVDTGMVAGYSVCWILFPFSSFLVADIRHVVDSFRAELTFSRAQGWCAQHLRASRSLSLGFNSTGILA